MINIKNIRKENGISQSDLAKRLKVGQSAVAMWETGKSIPTSDKLPELAKIFNCTIDELFEEGR